LVLSVNMLRRGLLRRVIIIIHVILVLSAPLFIRQVVNFIIKSQSFLVYQFIQYVYLAISVISIIRRAVVFKIIQLYLLSQYAILVLVARDIMTGNANFIIL
jgi:hypothetical protein